MQSGDHCEFCRISAETIASDRYSINNLGVCYDYGYCGYKKDKAKAIAYYTLAARWGVDRAVANLASHGIPAPAPDLKLAEDQRDRELIGGILATALVAGAVAVAAQNQGAPRKISKFCPTAQLIIRAAVLITVALLATSLISHNAILQAKFSARITSQVRPAGVTSLGYKSLY